MKIDLKSFLIGALSVVCVVLLTGATKGNKPQQITAYDIYSKVDEVNSNVDDVLIYVSDMEEKLRRGRYRVNCN
tara:strand:+ start:303 stop:524 length:222 start_codon:yes stop_codon:yes gene_type:complete